MAGISFTGIGSGLQVSEIVDAIVNAWNERLGITKDRADQIKSTTF